MNLNITIILEMNVSSGIKWLWDATVSVVQRVLENTKITVHDDDILDAQGPKVSVTLDVAGFLFGKDDENPSTCPASATQNHTVDKYKEE